MKRLEGLFEAVSASSRIFWGAAKLKKNPKKERDQMPLASNPHF